MVPIRAAKAWPWETSVGLAFGAHGEQRAVKKRITVVGAGIMGAWQALTLARAGYDVMLVEGSAGNLDAAASLYAGAMLAPYCEAEAGEPELQSLGLRGLALWQRHVPGVISKGTLVLASPRDRPELMRFARLTDGHEAADAARIAELEPAFRGRYASGLFYPAEAHVVPEQAMRFLLDEARSSGAEVRLNTRWTGEMGEDQVVVDCRGLQARGELPSLRGVRGERIVVRTAEVELSRPVRLLHPRHPLYVVPWGDGRFMVGATVIEREDAGAVTVRSALELLGMAYALHSGFGEAEIVDLGAGVRPAFPDNMPKAIVRGCRIYVNGAYRHGFLLAPVLAEAVAAYLATGEVNQEVLRVDG